MNIYQALTIAGSDSGGGAGIQADLKTFQERGVFGMSAITAVTAQNTLGVQGVYPLGEEAVRQQLQSIADDLPPHAVKTGMLFSAGIIKTVAGVVRERGWRNLVVDPVMIAKGGASLLRDDAVEALRQELLPLAQVVTPNIPEAEALIGAPIRTREERIAAARQLHEWGARHVVLKGGHAEEEGGVSDDLLYDGEAFTEFSAPRIETRHTHGTGCTFAAAIAAELAKGRDVHAAVYTAKAFIQAAIANPLAIGGGHGPTNHWAYRRMQDERGEASLFEGITVKEWPAGGK